MTVGMVAMDYLGREHRDEMISRVRQSAEVMAATPGCLAADCWLSEDNQSVATTGQRESEQALTAGFSALRARPDWRVPTPGASARRGRTSSARRQPPPARCRSSPPAPAAGPPRVTRCHHR